MEITIYSGSTRVYMNAVIEILHHKVTDSVDIAVLDDKTGEIKNRRFKSEEIEYMKVKI